MPFKESITKGIRFILSHRNPNGGVPAVSQNDVSGCWTTAEALEFFLTSIYFQKADIYEAKSMLEFLLKTQISGQGWPLVVNSKTVSTMATGHSLAALVIAENVFSKDSDLVSQIQKAMEDAKKWLHEWQNNEDGGWGVEPSDPNGRESRVISTCYALHGYFACDLFFDNSQDVKRGINYLMDISNPNGGWGGKKDSESDPANTARVITALLHSKHLDIDDVIIKKGKKFILKSKQLWRIDVESYITSGAPGHTIFHSNTLYDVLVALINCNYFKRDIFDLINWFIDSQEDDGRWYLQDKSKTNKDISMWSTSEAISVLDIAQEHYIKHTFRNYRNNLPHQWKQVLSLLVIINVLQFSYILGFHLMILSIWDGFSDSTKNYIVYGVFLTLLIGIFVNLITPAIRNVFDKISWNEFKEWFFNSIRR